MKLVDTSSWVDYMRGRNTEACARVESLLLNGQASWCEITLVELWHGTRGAREKRDLAEMERQIELVPVESKVWRFARKLALRCQEKGITVPVSDMVIAACAVTNNLELEHCDKHFDHILPLAKSL